MLFSVIAIADSNYTNTSQPETAESNVATNIFTELINQSNDGAIEEEIIQEDEVPVASNDTTEEEKFDVTAHLSKINTHTRDFFNTKPEEMKEERFIVLTNKNKILGVKSERRVSDKIIIGQAKVKDIEKLIEDPEVEYLELDQDISLSSESVPWGVEKVNAPPAWDYSTGSGVKVAILDSGVDINHEDLSNAGGVSFVSSTYDDINGHGTMVSGIVSATANYIGVKGIAYGSELYAVKITNDTSGQLSDAISGLQWAIDNDMDIAVMSFGFGFYSQIFKELVQDAYEDGMLLVGAAGNDDTNVDYPAAYDDVIAVGAVDSDDERASFSNFGIELELVAPGVDINSTDIDDSYSTSSGTSFAAPHVAGVAALIMAYNNSLTNEEVRGKLRNDALDLGDSGKDDYYGYGLVQVNLTSLNYTLMDDSYYYKIFNISDYGSENQTQLLWLNRTGTIDYANFSIGYYQILKYDEDSGALFFNKTLNVTENGSFYLYYISISYWDDWSGEGDYDDAKVWYGDDVYLDFTFSDSSNELDVVCVEYGDEDSTLSPDECWAQSSTALSNCRAEYSFLDDFCDAYPSDCYSYGAEWSHTHPDSFLDEANHPRLRVLFYLDCDSSPDISSQLYNDIYVYDMKKTYCAASSTTYDVLGWYYDFIQSERGWYKINNVGVSCGSGKECDLQIQGTYETTNKNYDFSTGDYHPCRTSDGGSCSVNDDCLTDHYCVGGTCRETQADLCDGRIVASVTKSNGDPIEGAYIKFNGASNGTSDDVGLHYINLTKIDCGVDQNISVYCPDNASQICKEKSTSLDFDGDIDTLEFECNICDSNVDMSVSSDDIVIRKVGNYYNVSASVRTENIGSGSTVLSFKSVSKDTGLIVEEKNCSISLSSYSTINCSVELDLDGYNEGNGDGEKTDYIHVYLDPDNQYPEEPADNNYAAQLYVEKRYEAYLVVNTGIPVADSAIRQYLTSYIDPVDNPSGSVFHIVVGDPVKSNYSTQNAYTKQEYGEWYEQGVYYNNQLLGSDQNYVGLVSSFKKDGYDYIFIYGADIEGVIAGVKRMINAKDKFLNPYFFNFHNYHNKGSTEVIDQYDPSGIKIMDLMHNSENNPYYKQNNEQFKEVVSALLNDNNFEVSIKSVKTANDNTTLRLKSLSSDFTTNYTDIVLQSPQPVVLAHGIHSDLLTWEDFGKEIAEEGRDVWLLEMYGGPTTEDCDYGKCPNYTISDLTQYYWPALIAGVEEYSGQDNLSYVGYDLGCTIALESLENYSTGKNDAGYYFDYNTGQYLLTDLSQDVIDTFVGIGCIGNFTPSDHYITNRLSFFSDVLNRSSRYFKDSGFINNHFFHGHTPGYFYKVREFAVDFLFDAKGYTNPADEISVMTWIIQKVTGTSLKWLSLIKDALFAASYPSPEINSKPVSSNVLLELTNIMNGTVQMDVGTNVNITNVLIIEGFKTYNSVLEDGEILDQDYVSAEGTVLEDDKGTDKFVSHNDQEIIYNNSLSSNKYYVSFPDVNHFTTVLKEGLADYSRVRSLVIYYLQEKQVEESNIYEIK